MHGFNPLHKQSPVNFKMYSVVMAIAMVNYLSSLYIKSIQIGIWVLIWISGADSACVNGAEGLAHHQTCISRDIP